MVLKNKIALLLIITSLLLSLSINCFGAELFTDVPKTAWEAEYVYNLVERGVVGGYGDGTFGPDRQVERCEYAKMLVGISGTPISDSVSTPYEDVPEEEWYFPYVNSSLPFMTGFTVDGKLYFRPVASATREAVTVALVKALKLDIKKYTDPTDFLSERFWDVDTIAAHNRKYVAAAVDNGFITGDTEGTFRGQEPIIRAEIVAVLCRAFPEKKKEPAIVEKEEEPTEIVTDAVDKLVLSQNKLNDIA